MKAITVFFMLLLICGTVSATEENPVVDANGDPIGDAARSIELTYKFTITDVPADASTIRAWAPIPASGMHQDFEGIDVAGDYNYTIVREKQYHNMFLIFSFTADDIDSSGNIPVSVRYEITRHAFRMDEAVEGAVPLDDQTKNTYLSADYLIPIDGKIREEARDLVCACCSPPMKSARAVYDNILETLTYDKSGDGWGRGDALLACETRKGNGTDFHSLFIGEARALGVPSKFVMGIQLPDGQNSGDIDGYHCWAEFYIDDRGWVPVDASEAKQHPERTEAFFAGLDANRIQFTMGRDLKLPRSAAAPLNFFLWPHVEVDSREHSDVDMNISFRDI